MTQGSIAPKGGGLIMVLHGEVDVLHDGAPVAENP